ncbi:MAG: alpha/beta hydrolase family protein [Planctomycetota bacterium]|jgi:acetyl esterase/lipase
MRGKITILLFSILLLTVAFYLNGCSNQTLDLDKNYHARLMLYIDGDGDVKKVESFRDWQRRRKEILDGMQKVMGTMPKKNAIDMDIRTTHEEKRDGYTRYTINFLVEKDERVYAYLYVPQQKGQIKRLPAMLILHSSISNGKEAVDGQTTRKNRAYARELAERGYVVLAPDYPPFGESKGYDFENDRYESGTMKGIYNHTRCIDLLHMRPDVDSERTGVIGHSLGGHNAIFIGAFDPRLQVVVTSCGWTPFHYYRYGDLTGWISDRYMPLIRDKYELNPDKMPFDFYEAVAIIAPRAFFTNSPLHDTNFEVRGVKDAIPEVAKIYKLYGAEDKLQVRYPDCGHDFPPEVRKEAYEFIDKILRHKKRDNVFY